MKLDVAYLKSRQGLQDELKRSGARLFCLDGTGGRAGWALRACDLVRRIRPDLIHTTLADSNLVGRAAAVATGTPIVCSLVSLQYGPEQRSDPNVRPWRMRLVQTANVLSAKKVARFHAVTDEVAAVMSRRLLIPKAKIEVIPRGRDPQRLGVRTPERRQLTRQKIGIHARAPLILAAARQEHVKRLELLIQAFRLVVRTAAEARLVIAGREGNATELLRDLVRELRLEGQVQFLGNRNDVPDLLCAADVVVLTSDREGLPGILIEAMALEAPIIATDLPGVREAVGGKEVATLVDGSDPAHFAHAIASVLQDPEGASQRASMGRVRFLENFTVELVADRWVEFYDRALEGRTLTQMS